MSGTYLGLALVALIALGIVVAVIVMRASGPRPDAPLKGHEDDARQASGEGAQWKADRPGGPGAEAEDPTNGASPSPGAEGDDTPGRHT